MVQSHKFLEDTKNYFSGISKKCFRKVRLAGDGVYLREMTLDDVSQKYCNWLNDKEANQYLETRVVDLNNLKDYVQKKINSSDCIFLDCVINKKPTCNTIERAKDVLELIMKTK